jgi:hypothetical protein
VKVIKHNGKVKAPLGGVSSGTRRMKDLLGNFGEALAQLTVAELESFAEGTQYHKTRPRIGDPALATDGSLRDVFADWVEDYRPQHAERVRTLCARLSEIDMVRDCLAEPDEDDDGNIDPWDHEEALSILGRFEDALQEYAPDGAYFGPAKGDETAFGFWAKRGADK